jgi:hypothetical protein
MFLKYSEEKQNLFPCQIPLGLHLQFLPLFRTG